MKNVKQTKSAKEFIQDELLLKKPKKKLVPNENKVNIKSKKFWEELYDNEGEEIEKYLR